MKTLLASEPEYVEFQTACYALSCAIDKLSTARGALAMAGCGTFQTMKDYDKLQRLDKQLLAMHKRLFAKQKRITISAPSVS